MIQKICVLGLSYIGLPTSITLANAGFKVHGVDIKADVVAELEAGRLHFSEPDLPEAFASARKNLSFGTAPEEADMFIIAVQTPCLPDKNNPGIKRSDVSYVRSAAEMVAKVLKKGDLVVLESTVPPETTRMVESVCAEISGLSRDDFYTAHCPERVIPGSILKELRGNDRIIGARDRKAAELAKGVYEKVAVDGHIHITDDITAEACKLVENTYRDINIAYANELSILAAKLGIDVYSLINLANCHPRVNIHTPGVGVGGHCIAVDPWFLHEKEDDTEGILSLIKTARLINDSKPHWVAERIAAECEKGADICVMGLAYKPDVDDLRESPSLILCNVLRDMGFNVTGCEPNVSAGEIGGFKNLTVGVAINSGAYLVVTLKHTDFLQRKYDILGKPHFDCVSL